jgi:hypothetical protein
MAVKEELLGMGRGEYGEVI